MLTAHHHVECSACEATSVIPLPAEDNSPATYECPECGGVAFQTLLEIKDEHGNVT